MEKLLSKTTQENSRVAKLILQKLSLKNSNLILLKAKMGSGKTTLVHEIANQLNSINKVSSPTFVLEKIYNLNSNKLNFKNIHHIDLYRLSSTEEVYDLNLFENLKNKNELFIVEWPGKAIKIFKDYPKVICKIIANQDESRLFYIS